MPKFLNNINLEAANDIQFKTTAGANAGKIEQDGNNLVLSNAVGDVLLGDGSSDVYIGDGTNNVDILFEQSGSIKGDGSAVTLTIGGANTTLNLENPNINGAFSIGTTSINNKLTFTTANGYILFDHEPSGDTGAYEGTTSVPLLKIDTGGTEKSILERVSEQGGILLGADDSVIIAAGDTRNTLRSNLNEAEEKVIFASEGGFHAYGFPSNNTTWSNRNEFRFRSDSATASDNGLYIGEGTNVQFIDLSRNLKNIGTIGSAAITSTGSVTATSFIKSGGTTNQFLKADGSVDSNTYATQSYVSTQVSNLVDSAPTTLDTLNELATALGDDASFSTTMSTSLGNRLRVDTASQGLNSTQKSNARTNLGLGTAATSASTAFATAAQGTSAENALPKAGGTMTGALNTGANAFGGTYLSINSGGVTQWGASRGILTWDTNWASIYATSGKELRLGAGGGNDNSIILDGSTVEINKDITTTGTVTATGGNSTNWNTAYTDRNKWDGGSTGLTASTGRTSLGLGSAATQNTSAFATAAQGTSAETAYGWGDHSGAGYLTSSSTQSKYLRSDASDSFSGKLTGTATNENLEVGGIRGTAKGSQTGDYIHLYERVHIGGPSGWGHSTHGAPSNGLSVWGAIDLGMGGSGALQVDGTTVLTNARVLQNVTAAAGIITSGTFADARIPSLAASKITSGNLDNARMPTHVDIGGKLDIGVSTNYGTTTNADKLWIASFNTGQSDVPGSYYDIINLSSNSAHGIQIASNFGASSGAIYMRTRSDNAAAPAGSGLQAWNKIWHHNNDGTGSGLDADLLDAQEGSYYRNATNLNAGTVAADRLSTASTQPPNDNSTKIATTAYVQTELTDLIGAAPAALDTLSELADAINDDSTFSSTVTTALGNRLRVDTASQGLNSTQKSNARTNLGLGTAATSASTAFAPAAGSTSIVSLGTVVAGDWNAGVISSTYLDADTAHLSGTQTFSGAKTFSSTGNTFNGHHYFSAYNSAGNHYPHYMHGSTGGAKVNVRVYNTGGGSADVLYFAAGDNNMTWRGNKIWNAGNDGAGTGLDADLLDGNHASAFMGSSGMAANTDVYMNFRVLRNSNSSSANDGMYIGYGNSNSGQTRIFGGGSTGVHLAINATNMAFNNNAVWHAGNDGSGSGLDADKLDGVDGVVLAQSLRAGLNVTGGGTITVDASYYIKNSSRFIVISAGRGSNFATDGYFDIDIPTSGTITGVGGASNKTATSNGIPLASWEALYYILPLGSAATSQAANFKVVRYTSGFDIPYNWVLLAVRNSDGTNQVSILGGKYILGAGQSINTQSYNSRRIEFADKLTTARTIAGTSFNGSANIDISYNNLTNKPTIPSLSGYATQSYVGTQISNLIDSSPAALNTLNELAAALGDDANFSTTITDSIATKAPLASPTFTGAVTLSGSIQNNNQATSIDLKDHSNYTWFRNAANRWVFQGGADGDDWTQHFALKLETVGTGYNDKYAELGQQQNNGSNGGRYKGVRIVKSTGSSSVVDGELKAGDGVFSGSVTGSNLNISNWNTSNHELVANLSYNNKNQWGCLLCSK